MRNPYLTLFPLLVLAAALPCAAKEALLVNNSSRDLKVTVQPNMKVDGRKIQVEEKITVTPKGSRTLNVTANQLTEENWFQIEDKSGALKIENGTMSTSWEKVQIYPTYFAVAIKGKTITFTDAKR